MHAVNPVVPSEGGSSSLGGGGGGAGAGIWQLPLGLFPWQHWEPPKGLLGHCGVSSRGLRPHSRSLCCVLGSVRQLVRAGV